MRYLVLVSHGKFAEGLHDTLSMFVPDDGYIISVGLQKGSSAYEFHANLERKLKVVDSNLDNVVLLADIQGGSPLTNAVGVLRDLNLYDKSDIYVGMNLPLALNILLCEDGVCRTDLDEFALEGVEIKRFMLDKHIIDEEI